jgi:hypothetical protein
MPNPNSSTVGSGYPRSSRAVPRRAVRIGRAALLVAVLSLVALVLGAGQVPCGFARVLHVPCPGCGSTRAMLALLSFDLPALVRFNPLAPVMTLLASTLALQGLLSLLRSGTLAGLGEGRVGVLVARGAVVVALLEVALWLARFGGAFGGPVPV